MTRRRLRVGLAVVLAGLLVLRLAAASEPSRAQDPAPASAAPQAPGGPVTEQERRGRALFVDGCSSCHGEDLRGIPGRAPSLRGVGALAADFYLRTGRMPLDDPEDQPLRNQPAYTQEQRAALIAYIGSFGGPRIPEVHPERGDLAEGRKLFTESCAGCHQVVGKGGVVTGDVVVPDLESVKPIDVAEALHVGPYLMPRFRHLDEREVDSLARYVAYTQDPADRGGWGIGHIGPIPEGLVTAFLAMAVLLLTIRIIGERTTQ